jgi:hypothetical protein
VNLRTDPDETTGRALYRAMAERDARISIGLARKARLVSKEPEPPAKLGMEPLV